MRTVDFIWKFLTDKSEERKKKNTIFILYSLSYTSRREKRKERRENIRYSLENFFSRKTETLLSQYFLSRLLQTCRSLDNSKIEKINKKIWTFCLNNEWVHFSLTLYLCLMTVTFALALWIMILKHLRYFREF